MAKMKDADFFQDQIKLAKKKTKEYRKSRDHNYDLYSGCDLPESGHNLKQVYSTNEVYPIIESSRALIGYNNPKAILQPKRDRFFVSKQVGEPDWVPTDEIDANVIQEMNDTNQDRIEISNQGEVFEWLRLDGNESSKVAESAINEIIKEKKIKDELNKAKDDLLLSGCGCVWVDYYTDFFLPTEDTDLVKNNDIVVKHGVLGKDFLIDPTIKNIHYIHEAKWVAKKFQVSLDDLDALKGLETIDGKPFFKKGAIENLIDNPEASQSVINEENKRLMSSDIVDDPRTRVVNFWQVWIRPSLKDRLSNGNFKRGKITYFVEGHNEEVTVPRSWNKLNDTFPLKLTSFNLSNKKFVPISDISVYEPQLAQLNNQRSRENDLADVSSRLKALINTGAMDDDSIERVKRQLGSDQNELIPVDVGGSSMDNSIKNITLGTNNSSIYSMANKTSADIQRTSMTGNTSKGIATAGEVSATATAAADRSTTARSGYRQNIFAELWVDVIEEVFGLMKQYYTNSRMVKLEGEKAEWTTFSRDDIQIEVDVDIDVMTLSPMDQVTKRQELMNMFNILITIFDNPNRYLKVLSEGRTIVLSAYIEEILKLLNLKDDRFYPKVDDQTKETSAFALGQATGIQAAQPRASVGRGGQESPSVASSNVTDTRQEVGATGGSFVAPGDTVAPGGQGKLEQPL